MLGLDHLCCWVITKVSDVAYGLSDQLSETVPEYRVSTGQGLFVTDHLDVAALQREAV